MKNFQAKTFDILPTKPRQVFFTNSRYEVRLVQLSAKKKNHRSHVYKCQMFSKYQNNIPSFSSQEFYDRHLSGNRLNSSLNYLCIPALKSYLEKISQKL